jgi:hypothetical protein
MRKADPRNCLKCPYWLKENNSVYSDIIISQDRINLLPLDDELQDISTLEYREETQHLNDQGPMKIAIAVWK